jgi:tRNA pseudouridine55 synthase
VQNDYSGLLVVNKPVGVTSFKLISIIKKKLQVKKVGHCGTLDPLASGLMLVLIDKATKLQDNFMKKDKVYLASVKLGLKTASGDLDGKIISQSDYSHVDIDEIKKVCDSFIGEIEQIPPMFSALKVGGKKLYELARKGIEIERKKRKIKIYFINVLNYSNGIIDMRVKCSSGTYIRTLAEDIGTKLNTDAVLNNLVREEIDEYLLKQSMSLADIENNEKEFILDKIIQI